MTKGQIEQYIEKLLNGRAATTDAHQIELIDLGLSKYRKMLSELEQKKSESQEAQKIQNVPNNVVETREGYETTYYKPQPKVNQEPTTGRVLVARVEPSPVVQIPVVEVTLRIEKTDQATKTKETVDEVRVMDRADILRLLKTYYKALVNSAGWQGGRYTECKNGNMGYNVRELFKGWNTIHQITGEGEQWPPESEVYPRLGYASQAHRVGSDVLYRWLTE